MGLSDVVARWAARHAHVLVVEVPGHWSTRAAVEQAALTRGWHIASAPADADVLVVCGRPGLQLADAVELVWQQMPGPRARVEVQEYDDVPARLDEAHRLLLDAGHQGHDARHRPDGADLLAAQAEHGNMDHGDMDHDDMDHDDMDHDDMEMAPSGIPLAEGGEDRDGLEMDVLHVPLGPVLPHWPAGLVLRCSLQGDVIIEADAELLDGPSRHENPATPLARRLDNLTSLLALAGWEHAATEARRVRDAVLVADAFSPGDQVVRLADKIRRSRILRRSLRGVRPLTPEEVHHPGLPPDAAGDTYARLLEMLDAVTATSEDPSKRAGTRLSADQLARLVVGLDLATARLVIASLDLHRVTTGHAEQEVTHG